MSRQKRFSKFTIVATILIAASATCFGQGESSALRTEPSEPASVAINKAPKVDKAIRVSNSIPNTAGEAVVKENRTGFSVAKFMSSAKQAMVPSSLTFAPTLNNELKVDSFKAPRNDEFDQPATTKRITFVPSRGQKLPD